MTTFLLYFVITAKFSLYTLVCRANSGHRFVMKSIIKSSSYLPYPPALDLQACILNKLPLDASALNFFYYSKADGVFRILTTRRLPGWTHNSRLAEIS